MRNHQTIKVLLALAVAVGGLIPAAGVGAATSNPHTVSSGSLGGIRYHVVAKGDSVASIAKAYGVDPDTIRTINGIVGDKLYLGARVLLDAPNPGLSMTRVSSSTPAPAASSGSSGSSGSSSSGGTYTVKEGDVLERIARRHGVKLSALLAANGLEATSLILPGRTLAIPSGGSATGSSSGSSSSGAASSSHGGSGSSGSSVRTGPTLVCPVPGATFMNDWGFPRGDERFHEGTDMFAPNGTTIVAPVSGVVTFGSNNLGGTTFNITTADGWSIYGAHLSATIGDGGQVAAGTPIGKVGNSGDADGGDTHLHLGVRPAAGRPMNPYPSVLAACG